MKSLKLISMVVFMTLGIVGCGESNSEPLVEVKRGVVKGWISITSLTDSIVIKKIIADRGRCKYFVANKSIRAIPLEKFKEVSLTYNQRYGMTMYLDTEEIFGAVTGSDECTPREVRVVTDKGSWLFTFDY